MASMGLAWGRCAPFTVRAELVEAWVRLRPFGLSLSKPGLVRWFGRRALVRGGGRVSARRPTHFSLLRQRKVSKRKATLLSATPSLRCGATWGARARGAPWNSLRAGALRSDNHGESDDEAGVSCGTPATPRPARPRRIQKGLGANSRTGRRVARPHFAGISASRWAGAAERSDGPYGCLDVRLSNPCWLRLRRGGCGVGMGVEAPMLRQLTRRGCPNGAAKQRSEFCGAPRNRPAAGLPRSAAQGSQTGGRPFFGDFLSAKRKKVTALPGALPGTRHPTEHATRSGPWLRQAQPERVGVAPWLRPAQPERVGGQQTIRARTINFIAARAYPTSARAKNPHKPKRPTP